MRRAVAILNVSLMREETNEVSLRIGHDRTFAAFDLLACVKSARTTERRRRRQERLDQRRLDIRHIACVTQPVSTILTVKWRSEIIGEARSSAAGRARSIQTYAI